MTGKNKKGGGKDKKSVPPLKIEIVRDDKKSLKPDSLQERDPLAGIDDIDLDKNQKEKKKK